MKYKVGDKVRILRGGYDAYYWNEYESGDVQEITRVYGEDEYEVGHQIVKVSDFGPYTPPHQIEVGGKYTSRNGDTWECIFVRGGIAWLNHGTTTAYRWKVDGTPLCLGAGSEYTIDLGPKVETITVKGSIDARSSGCWITFHSDIGDHKFNMEVDLIDGVPDWSTAKVTPCD